MSGSSPRPEIGSPPPPGELRYETRYVARRSRVATFFRIPLMVPHVVVFVGYWLVIPFGAVGAWVTVVGTGRYPPVLYGFNAGFCRCTTRVFAYMYLLTDDYPPFAYGAGSSYPGGLAIGPPKSRYDRLSAFVRIVPVALVTMIHLVLAIPTFIAAVSAWFTILVTGRMPPVLFRTIRFGLSQHARIYGYGALLTERRPRLREPAWAGLGGGA